MSETLIFHIESLIEMFMPLVIFLLTLFFGLVFRKVVFVRLAAWAKHGKNDIDDIIIDAVRGPFVVWSLMLGLYFAAELSKLPAQAVGIISKILLVLGIFSAVLVLANIFSQLIKIYSGKVDAFLPVTTLTQNITRIVIFGIGILIILNTMGISITPILATLGVGGLAVALALQDTLSNLFAGFHVVVARQIKVGDYIKLESGEEGYVTDINWRTTEITMLPNNVILVPNEKLTKAIITNYSLPDKEMAVLVDINVHYKSDLKKVERITSEVAREVMKEVSGGIPAFEPFIRYHSFCDSGVKFTTILRAREFVDQYLIKHEFIKKLHERYAKEGIVIPYPMRTITYEEKEPGA